MEIKLWIEHRLEEALVYDVSHYLEEATRRCGGTLMTTGVVLTISKYETMPLQWYRTSTMNPWWRAYQPPKCFMNLDSETMFL